MKKTILIGIVAVVAAVVGASLWWRSGPRPSQFAYLATPRITHMTPQRMVVVNAAGDPNVVGARAFKLLFAAYFKTEGVSRWERPPAPRARWPRPAETPKSEWIGQYALPVGSQVSAGPTVDVDPGFRVSLETWEYGDVAEILHVGPYSDEEADIVRLQTFIAASGYHVIGDHEEEYVRGPGMVFAGDPRKYLTIIRLRVALAAEPTVDW